MATVMPIVGIPLPPEDWGHLLPVTLALEGRATPSPWQLVGEGSAPSGPPWLGIKKAGFCGSKEQEYFPEMLLRSQQWTGPADSLSNIEQACQCCKL